jgi:hypothetical protein
VPAPDPTPPAGARPPEQPPAARRLPVTAILIGALTDIASTILAGLLIQMLALLSVNADPGGTEALREVLSQGGWPILGIVMGSLCTVLGGYVAARRAGENELTVGALCGLVSLLLTEALSSLGGQTGGPDDFGMRVAGWLVTIPLAMLGAHWRMRQKARPPAGRAS